MTLWISELIMGTNELMERQQNIVRKSVDKEADALKDGIFQPYGFTETPKRIDNSSSTFNVSEEDGKVIGHERHTLKVLHRSCRTIKR